MQKTIPMVIYEVNLVVDNDVAGEFDVWLQDHIRAVVDLPEFLDAALYRSEGETDRQMWTVHYWPYDRAALQRYLDHHASRFRQEGLDRFGGRFEADRRILLQHGVYRSGVSRDPDAR